MILATGSYIGEGFDDARLDTLFLAMPISWRGTLQQYVGRLHRLHDNKRVVEVTTTLTATSECSHGCTSVGLRVMRTWDTGLRNGLSPARPLTIEGNAFKPRTTLRRAFGASSRRRRRDAKNGF